MGYFEQKYNKFFQPQDKKNRFLLCHAERITDICVGYNRGTYDSYYLLPQCFAILENQNDRKAFKDADMYVAKLEIEIKELREQLDKIKKYIK